VISELRYEVEDIGAPLGYYAMVIPYRRFGTNYRSHIEGSRIQEASRQPHYAVSRSSNNFEAEKQLVLYILSVCL
jgi:hypothetical protein